MNFKIVGYSKRCVRHALDGLKNVGEWLTSNKLLLTLIFIVLVAAFLFHLFISHENLLNKWNDFGKTYAASGTWYYLLIILVTAVLALIADTQLKHIKRNIQTANLLKIDERWGSKLIVKARTIIHAMQVSESKQGFLKKKPTLQVSYENIGTQIFAMSTSGDPKAQEDFVSLLNLLDFLETLGVLCRNKRLDHYEVEEWCPDALKIDLSIFSFYIVKEREANENKKNEKGNKDYPGIRYLIEKLDNEAESSVKFID